MKIKKIKLCRFCGAGIYGRGKKKICSASCGRKSPMLSEYQKIKLLGID